MQRFLFLSFGILFFTLLGVFYTESSANAASIYDDTINTTQTLEFGRNGEYTDLSGDWLNYINEQCSDDPQTEFAPVVESIRQAINGEYGAVALTEHLSDTSTTPEKAVIIFWTHDTRVTPIPTFYRGGTTNNPQREYGFQSTEGLYAFSQQSRADRNSCTQSLTYADEPNLSAYAGPTLSEQILPNRGHVKLYYSQFEFVPPPEYEGTTPPETAPKGPENLRPEYTYQVGTNGKLSVSYTKNLDYFLTGTSYFVLEKMNDNWEGLQENIYSNLAYTPAGSLTGDSKFAVLNDPENIDMVVPEPGYYMLRIDHNQQLDTPPWPENASDSYIIEQVWLQFYWDGSSIVTGDNIGGCEGICNDELGTANNKILTALRKFNIDDHGLQAIIFIPIEFFATLPSITESCTPLNIPFIDRNMSIQCVREPINQAHPNLVFLITIFINGLVTLGVAFALFRHIKNLHDPKKDEIEVLKL